MRKFTSAVRADPLVGVIVILVLLVPAVLVASLVVRFTGSDAASVLLFAVAAVTAVAAAVLGVISRCRSAR